MTIQGILIGILMIAAGVGFLKFRLQFANMIGHNNIFERKLGAGATFNLITLGALLLVPLGILVMFGLGDNILGFLLSPVTNAIN